MAMLTFERPVNAMNVVESCQDNQTFYCFSKNIINKTSAVVEVQTIRFDSGIAKVTYTKTVKSCDKLFKYRFYDKESLQLERFIKDYVIYTHLLPHHRFSLPKLRRLNV